MKDSTCSRTEYAKRLLTILFWIGLWQVLYVIVGREYMIPSPLHTLKAAAAMVTEGAFYADVACTMGRVVFGMVLSFGLGALCAGLAYGLPAVRRILSGPMVVLKSVPVMSVIMIAILTLPTDGVPVFVCFLMCFPVVYTNVLAGFDSVDGSLIEVCEVYRIYGKRRFLALYWPSLRPFIKAALTLISGLSWKTIVASEIFAVPRHSMGYHLLFAKTLLEADQLFAWTIIIVLFSFAFEKIVKALIARDWKTGVQGAFFYGRHMEEPTQPCWVEVRGVSRSFGEQELYREFSMEIPAGEITAIIGPSGCGKTTLLKMIMGLVLPEKGSVILHGPVTERVSVVFQENRLFPWMTVRENLRMVAEETRVEEVLRLMGLEEYGEYLPEQLSGGMCRRVAMGRALVYDGAVTLMDEPFTGLDEELKGQLRQKIRTLWKEQNKTVVVITHDRGDAEYLADHMAELSGRPVSLRRIR